MIYSDNSFSLDIPCKYEGGCIKRDFYFLKDFFFFSWNWMKPSDWIYSGQHTDWRLKLIWTWPQLWLIYETNLRWASDLLTWILPDWKESLMESWHLHSLPFNFNKNFTLLFG